MKKNKIIAEIRSILLTTAYFFSWFGGLMIIKILLLREYDIQFTGFAIVLVGALVMAKVVLLLEFIPLPFTKDKPAWIEVTIRTVMYLAGVILIMVLEKSFEARHEYNGIFDALKNIASHYNNYHIWINTICVFGALLIYNVWSVFKMNYGKEVFWKLMTTKIPSN